MSKLDTLNRNIARHKATREAKAQVDATGVQPIHAHHVSPELPTEDWSEWRRAVDHHRQTFDYSVMAPPQALINRYALVIRAFIKDKGSEAQYTRAQHCQMIEDIMMKLHRELVASEALGKEGSPSFWIPKVKLVDGHFFEFYLNSTMIGSIS